MTARAKPDAVTRELKAEGCQVQLDLTPQVLSLSMPLKEPHWRHGALTAVPEASDFVSASMLAIHGKLFDDGLYAAAELAAQDNKAKLLLKLAGISPLVDAAARLGGLTVPTSNAVDTIIQEFLSSELGSKPIGFHTWSEALGRIFQQDRLLQQELKQSEAAALADAARNEPEYGACLDFIARLTNPLVDEKPDLRRPGGRFFFPPSRAHETELVKRLIGGNPIPDGFSLAKELVKRLRSGALDLTPGPASGWYDWQTWALEPLALLEKMPEGRRVRIDRGYREQLEELFKAVLSLTRETHVKQLEAPFEGAMGPFSLEDETIITVVPDLKVEPLLTYCERRAAGYDFVRGVLESLRPLHSLRRVTYDGVVSLPLDQELTEITSLFRGAAAVVGDELGMRRATGSDAEHFRRWARARSDTVEDIRMMVPVFYDDQRRQTKVWAILGWATRSLYVSFATPPIAHIIKGNPIIGWSKTSYQVAYPVFEELYVSRILNRDEFRAHCDCYKTRENIIAHL